MIYTVPLGNHPNGHTGLRASCQQPSAGEGGTGSTHKHKPLRASLFVGDAYKELMKYGGQMLELTDNSKK